jgi:hypothetical protein
MRPLCITDPEYAGHDQEIQSFNQFLSQYVNFQHNRRLTPMNFDRKYQKN